MHYGIGCTGSGTLVSENRTRSGTLPGLLHNSIYFQFVKSIFKFKIVEEASNMVQCGHRNGLEKIYNFSFLDRPYSAFVDTLYFVFGTLILNACSK